LEQGSLVATEDGTASPFGIIGVQVHFSLFFFYFSLSLSLSLSYFPPYAIFFFQVFLSDAQIMSSQRKKTQVINTSLYSSYYFSTDRKLKKI